MRLREFAELLVLRFTVAFRNLAEYSKIVIRYYRDILYLKVDTYLLRSYLTKNPFHIAKQYLIEQGEKDLYSYGETPLTTVDQIAFECGIEAKDIVFELGAGRGRACFWLNHFIGCTVVGIECIPEFVEIANRVKRRYMLNGISFKCEDILHCDFKQATVIYFYGTCSESNFIKQLIVKLAKAPKGTKVITVSYPLTAYSSKHLFDVIKVFSARFTWGEADVYLQVRR